jgi:hypothetical protein
MGGAGHLSLMNRIHNQLPLPPIQTKTQRVSHPSNRGESNREEGKTKYSRNLNDDPRLIRRQNNERRRRYES